MFFIIFRSYYKRFVVGIDRAKMKLYDVEASAQTGLQDSGQSKPVFDKTGFGKEIIHNSESDGFGGFKF